MATKADSLPTSHGLAGVLSIAGDGELLDKKQLNELVTLDLLEQSFLNGTTQIRALVAQLVAAAQSLDIAAAYATIHRLPGVSGNIGAEARHAAVKEIYPPMADPTTDTFNWLTDFQKQPLQRRIRPRIAS